MDADGSNPGVDRSYRPRIRIWHVGKGLPDLDECLPEFATRGRAQPADGAVQGQCLVGLAIVEHSRKPPTHADGGYLVHLPKGAPHTAGTTHHDGRQQALQDVTRFRVVRMRLARDQLQVIDILQPEVGDDV